MPAATTSPITERAVAFVADHKPEAEALGRRLAAEIGDPDRFAATLGDGFASLGDPVYHEGSHMVVPGLGPTYGVRWPLIQATIRGFRDATRRERTSSWLFVADRLFRVPEVEARWFAFGLLDRLVLDDPERTWQLLRPVRGPPARPRADRRGARAWPDRRADRRR
jgi:hypothetical protein